MYLSKCIIDYLTDLFISFSNTLKFLNTVMVDIIKRIL